MVHMLWRASVSTPPSGRLVMPIRCRLRLSSGAHQSKPGDGSKPPKKPFSFFFYLKTLSVVTVISRGGDSIFSVRSQCSIGMTPVGGN